MIDAVLITVLLVRLCARRRRLTGLIVVIGLVEHVNGSLLLVIRSLLRTTLEMNRAHLNTMNRHRVLITYRSIIDSNHHVNGFHLHNRRLCLYKNVMKM